MRNDHVNRRQLGAWLFAGLSAPLAQFGGGMTWQMVALVAAICLTSCWFLSRTDVELGRWLCAVQYVWLIFVLASVGRWITGSWSGGNVYPVVPLVLLALAAVSTHRGSGNAARAGSVVFWLIGLIYSAVVAAGAGKVEPTELIGLDRKLDLRLVVILLVPALTACLPGNERKVPVSALTGIGVFAVLLSILITGALSVPVALREDAPLFEWVEGLSLAGTLQRFEALVSVALTMGWFALVSFLLCVAGQLADSIKRGSNRRGIWIAASAGSLTMLTRLSEATSVIGIGSAVMWVVVPGIMAIGGTRKKLKISKNNA